MRVLCRDHGWTTDGKTVKLPAPGDRYSRLLFSEKLSYCLNFDLMTHEITYILQDNVSVY